MKPETTLRPGFLHRGDLGMQRSKIAPLLTGEELAELFALADFCIGAGGSLHFGKVSPMARRLKELRLIEWVREPEKHSGRLHRLTKLGWLTLLTRAETEMRRLLPAEDLEDAAGTRNHRYPRARQTARTPYRKGLRQRSCQLGA